VFEKPTNLFVAEFIGAPKMNIVKTDLVKEGDRYFVTPCGSKIEVTGEKGGLLNEKCVPSGEILLGVRPEHMKLAFESGENTMSARLEVNEMMGSELHLHVYTEDGTRWIVRVPTIDLTAQQRASLVNGAQVYITFEGKVMHFFDPATEKNLIY
jgi:multiple sugar transport system ATP-binding protein